MSHDLNDTLIFVKVVEHGSFVSAAKSLRLPKTTVSRKVQELEMRLGAQLLHRTTRKLGLTEAGNVPMRNATSISPPIRSSGSFDSSISTRTSGWRMWNSPSSGAILSMPIEYSAVKRNHPRGPACN